MLNCCDSTPKPAPRIPSESLTHKRSGSSSAVLLRRTEELPAGIKETAVAESESAMRAERAKPKSRRDGMIIAKGQRRTSAALGYGFNTNPSPFSGFAAPPPGGARQTRKKGRLDIGWALPRAAASAALPWAIIMLPLWGAGRGNCPWRPLSGKDPTCCLTGK